MIILDIDNCIADDTWRLKHIKHEEAHPFTRYHEYHLAAPFDKPHNKHLWAGRLASSVAILTARPEHYRTLTKLWLDTHYIPYTFLLMRPNNDHRDAVAMKEELLARLVLEYGVEKSRITHAYDDRWDITAMYRRNGLRASRVFIQDRPEPNPNQLDLFEVKAP